MISSGFKNRKFFYPFLFRRVPSGMGYFKTLSNQIIYWSWSNLKKNINKKKFLIKQKLEMCWNTVNPELTTTSEKRPPFCGPIFHYITPPVHNGHYMCVPRVIVVQRFDYTYFCIYWIDSGDEIPDSWNSSQTVGMPDSFPYRIDHSEQTNCLKS